jgi:hypothetical protein
VRRFNDDDDDKLLLSPNYEPIDSSCSASWFKPDLAGEMTKLST